MKKSGNDKLAQNIILNGSHQARIVCVQYIEMRVISTWLNQAIAQGVKLI
jgi:hypothetical protein